jgi:hypothetical protein
MPVLDAALVSADQPSLEQRGNVMNAGHDLRVPDRNHR